MVFCWLPDGAGAASSVRCATFSWSCGCVDLPCCITFLSVPELVRPLARVYRGVVRLRLVLLFLAAGADVSLFKCKDFVHTLKWKDIYLCDL